VDERGEYLLTKRKEMRKGKHVQGMAFWLKGHEVSLLEFGAAPNSVNASPRGS